MKTLRLSPTTLLALVAVAAATTTVACSDEKKEKAWSCSDSDVPMGEVVRCTQSALTLDGPVIDYTTAVATPTTDVYSCYAGEAGCPPIVVTGDAEPCTGANDNPDLCGPSSGSTTGGTGGGAGAGTESGSTADGSNTGGGAGAGAGTGTQSGSTADGSGATGGAGANGNGNGNGNNGNGSSQGGSSKKGPDECEFVSMPYCSGGGSTSDGQGSSAGGGSTGGGAGSNESGDANSGGTSDGTKGNGNGNGPSNGGGSNGGDSPGQAKKNGGTSDGASGTSGGGSSSGGKKGTHYTCTKDEAGNRVCETTPVCAPGSHPAACGACVDDGTTADCVPPSEGGCWVTGGGFIIGPNVLTGAAPDGHDNFGGNAKPMKDGTVNGHWNHVDHGTQGHSKGRPAYIVCRHVDEPGPGQPGGKKGLTANQVYFGGPAEWGTGGGPTAPGYWFDVVAKDHGEPGSVPKAKNGFMPDTYHFTIRKMDDATHQVSGAVVYETKETLTGGNIQIHPANNGHPYTPMGLPGWVSYEP